MFFVKNGFDVKKRQMARVIGLLAVISSSPVMVGRELMNRTNESIGRYENEQKDKNYMQDTFVNKYVLISSNYREKSRKKQENLERQVIGCLLGRRMLQ